jgi:beta-glucanase (GH16 family)
MWSDEFNGSDAPDTSKWGYELGYIRNNELQYYTNSTNNTRQYNGNLEITVRQEPVSGYNYTSGSITTEGKASWKFGKIEGRFKIPKGQGLWACFWTLGTNFRSVGWPACGEMDIFEHVNNESNSYHTAHWADTNEVHTGKMGTNSNIDVSQWHVYSIIWDASNITWYVDDVQVHQLSILNGVNSTQEYHLPQYILINLPIGGGWPGSPDATTVLPATMYCDYVRVYQITGG